MSSQAPQQSPLDQAKAESNELHGKLQRDLDSLRTAPINEFGNRIESLQASVKLSRDSALHNLEKALKISDSRIHDLENMLQAEWTRLRDVQRRLRLAETQAATSEMKSSAREKAADAKFKKTSSALHTAETKLTALGLEINKAKTEVLGANNQCAVFQDSLKAVEQKNFDLRRDLLAAQNSRKDLKKELFPLILHKTNLQAELETAKRHASAFENVLNSSRSRFNQFEVGMTALIDSYREHLTQTGPTPVSASPNNQQDNAGEREHGPQTYDDSANHPSRIHTLDGNNCPSQGCVHKRKASSTDRLVSSGGITQNEKRRAVTRRNDSPSQAVSSVTGDSLPLTCPRSEHALNTSGGLENTGTCLRGHVTTGPAVHIHVDFEVVVRPVSVVKFPDTLTGRWEALVPQDFRLQAHAMPSTVENRFDDLMCGLDRDIIVLTLRPAFDYDKADFHRILEYLTKRQRYAAVGHAGIGKVEDVYLIPAPSGAGYPNLFSELDMELLPSPKTEDVLFLAIVFRVEEAAKMKIQCTWGHLLRAIIDADIQELGNARECLRYNPLPVSRGLRLVVFGDEKRMHMLSSLPLCPEMADAKLRPSPQNFLRLSYTKLDRPEEYSVRGRSLPKCVFVLGRLVNVPYDCWELFVVDIQHKDRPLWIISDFVDVKRGLSQGIGLLTPRCPGSWYEWECMVTLNEYRTAIYQLVRDTGLRIERYGPADG